MAPPTPTVPQTSPSVAAADRPAVHADLEQLPDDTRAEIIDGRLILSPRPAPPHVAGASGLSALLAGPMRFGLGGPGGWWILEEPELHLGRNARSDESHVVIPDIVGWRRERMPELPTTAFFSLVPDWVCEFLSPSTAVDDRAEKMPFYAREGVSWLWLADANLRTLETYQLIAGRWTVLATYAGNAKVRAPPFDAIELDLRLLWEL